MQAAERVHHSPDPNAQDSAFTGGSKEDEPGHWDLTTEPGGVNPGKANILDAWSSFDPQGGNAFLYLGFAREAAQLLIGRIRPRAATTFLTFELNHDPRLWDNGQATIPCRSTGDVLVSYEASGNEISVVIQRWVTTQTNAASGCAATGHLDPLTSFVPNVDAQGAVNETDIRTYLPGAYANTIPTERFGETALNLGQVLGHGSGDSCFAFSSVWMHSRSSTSESSNMQDYVAPVPLTVRSCSASGTKFHDLNANGRARRRRAGIASLGDLGRLRRRRRARRQRAVRGHRQRRPVRDQRHPPGRRHVHVAGDAADDESPATRPRRPGGLHVPARRHARRYRFGARRHVPVRVAGEHREHDLRSRPRLRQLPGG